MKLTAVAVFISSLALSNALRCMTCKDEANFEDCDVNGYVRTCLSNEESCETVVRRYGDYMTVTKGCKQENACKNNQLQNSRYSGRSTQCNADQINSFCTCCCDDNLCNAGAPSCVDFYQPTQPLNDCPALPQTLPHGRVECYNGNEAGSVCEYQCTTTEFDVWPPRRNTNVCRGNGTWAHEAPCCARPCPPYFLFDEMILMHFASSKAEDELQALTSESTYAISEDAIKQSFLYFSGEPVESSVIRFNEYDGNGTRLGELTKERLRLENEGPVNLGAALEYALENLLTNEAGLRDSRVPKAITIITDRKPDDDAVGPAQEARRRGYFVYYIAVQIDGYRFDQEELLAITGAPKHISVLEGGLGALTEAQLEDMIQHFCQNPCEHVLLEEP